MPIFDLMNVSFQRGPLDCDNVKTLWKQPKCVSAHSLEMVDMACAHFPTSFLNSMLSANRLERSFTQNDNLTDQSNSVPDDGWLLPVLARRISHDRETDRPTYLR